MKHLLKITACTLCCAFSMIALTHTVSANTSTSSMEKTSVSSSGQFVKKRYSVHGSWEIVTHQGVSTIKFSDTFKTKNGPDLKVFLSPFSISELENRAELEGGLKLGVLKSNTGEQSYSLPEGTSLSDYKSVLIHCEAYSVLWGGFDIEE